MPRAFMTILAFSILEIAAQPDWVRDQVGEGLQYPRYFASYPDPEPAGSHSIVTYLQVFSKTEPYEGLACIRLEAENPKAGKDFRIHIELEDRKIFPDMTDSIRVFQRVGISDGDQWLFRKIVGKVTTYSNLPLGPSRYMSIEGGPRKKISTKELEGLFAASPLAYTHAEIDPEFSIRTFNRYGKLDAYDPDRLSLKDFKRIFLADSIGHWELAKAKKGDPEGFLGLLIRTKSQCQHGKVGEAKGNIDRLKSLLPGFYSIYSVEGKCLDASGNHAEALLAFRKARGAAPEHAATNEYLSGRIEALKKRLHPKAAKAGSP